jgi:hypothetical protein
VLQLGLRLGLRLRLWSWLELDFRLGLELGSRLEGLEGLEEGCSVGY